MIHILSINICQPKSLLNTTVVSSPAHQCIPGIHYALHIKKMPLLKLCPLDFDCHVEIFLEGEPERISH